MAMEVPTDRPAEWALGHMFRLPSAVGIDPYQTNNHARPADSGDLVRSWLPIGDHEAANSHQRRQACP